MSRQPKNRLPHVVVVVVVFVVAAAAPVVVVVVVVAISLGFLIDTGKVQTEKYGQVFHFRCSDREDLIG